ncbi:MAG: hypothetical protein JRI41_09305 [Deltaproteobacteria bacterium]|nr:hypothetical protein [Deltaproteobacteria bacterium]
MKLDFYRGAWSFRMSKGDCEAVTGSNGITVLLTIGSCEDAVNLNVDQKTRLKYRER